MVHAQVKPAEEKHLKQNATMHAADAMPRAWGRLAMQHAMPHASAGLPVQHKFISKAYTSRNIEAKTGEH